MKITFLGTGTSQGVPLIGCQCAVCRSADPRDSRLRSAVLIETGKVTMVIDTGPDFRQQMLRAQVQRLDAVLLTHAHRDHIAGLDDVRAFIEKNGAPMDVYAEKNVQDDLRKIFFYAFEKDKYPGVPEFVFHTIHTRPFLVNGLQVIPVRAMHYRLPVLGFRIDDFAYLTDVNNIPRDEKEKLRGIKYLVLDALRHQKHISHFSLNEALNEAVELNCGHVFFTHICHELGLHAQVQETLPAFASLAFDGLCLNI